MTKLSNEQKKQITIEQRKNEVKNDLKTSKIDFNNTDLLNLINTVDSIKTTEKNISVYMYKFERLDLDKQKEKKYRATLRKQRNIIFNNVFRFFKEKNEKELINQFNIFNEFYLKEYILNDYSLNSIASNRSDKETLKNVKTFLDIRKLLF